MPRSVNPGTVRTGPGKTAPDSGDELVLTNGRGLRGEPAEAVQVAGHVAAELLDLHEERECLLIDAWGREQVRRCTRRVGDSILVLGSLEVLDSLSVTTGECHNSLLTVGLILELSE